MKGGYEEVFPLMENSDIRGMADLVAFNNLHHRRAFKEGNVLMNLIGVQVSQGILGFGRQEVLEQSLAENMSLDEYNAALRKAHVWAVEQGISKAMETHGLDALVVPGWSWMSLYASFASKCLLQCSFILYYSAHLSI